MVNPIYGDSFYKIAEIFGPNSVDIKVEIIDFKRFIEKIMEIKGGGTLIIEKKKHDRRVKIILSNIDSGSVKAL